jgi:hypothetical protein
VASNFRIVTHRSSDSLHVKLMGDFDGSSAWQLLNFIKSSLGGVERVIVHTSCLRTIHPFGQNTFRQNLPDLNIPCAKILFTGENAEGLAPDAGPFL